MRLWSLSPGLLDTRGLVALWREALLAQKVLHGETKGYRHHPQLQRFMEHSDPKGAIAAYLLAVQREATARGYRFDASKIIACPSRKKIRVNVGQLEYELKHLHAKLKQRDPAAAGRLKRNGMQVHPSFRVVSGPIASWEVVG